MGRRAQHSTERTTFTTAYLIITQTQTLSGQRSSLSAYSPGELYDPMRHAHGGAMHLLTVKKCACWECATRWARPAPLPAIIMSSYALGRCLHATMLKRV